VAKPKHTRSARQSDPTVPIAGPGGMPAGIFEPRPKRPNITNLEVEGRKIMEQILTDQRPATDMIKFIQVVTCHICMCCAIVDYSTR
jgi:hypothetical protein